MMVSTDRPLVLDVKRNSLDDGPGIRSVVFFKGCPLSCVWCQNPESLRSGPELLRDQDACVTCLACVPACPHQTARPASEPQHGCHACGDCVEICPSASRRAAGVPLDTDALFESLMLDEPFYRRSSGGVTLSGGEPTLFVERVGGLAERLHSANIHVLLETCGHFQWDRFTKHLLPYLSTVYFDLKLHDPHAHQRWTGLGNQTIHANLRALSQTGIEVLPRVPLIPGLTDSHDNLSDLAELVSQLGLTSIALLPYNPTWRPKRLGLGLDLPYDHVGWMNPDQIARCEATVQSKGLKLIR